MPFWFRLIEQWVKKGKGEYGISFPFLVGAIAQKTNGELTTSFIRKVFQEIIENPISGHYCEVRWCGNINEPVASIKNIEDIKNVSIKDQYITNNQVSLAFTTDLMSMFNLNCTTKEECLSKLVELTREIVEKKVFSKNNGSFTEYTVGDLEFINDVYASCSSGSE